MRKVTYCSAVIIARYYAERGIAMPWQVVRPSVCLLSVCDVEVYCGLWFGTLGYFENNHANS